MNNEKIIEQSIHSTFIPLNSSSQIVDPFWIKKIKFGIYFLYFALPMLLFTSVLWTLYWFLSHLEIKIAFLIGESEKGSLKFDFDLLWFLLSFFIFNFLSFLIVFFNFVIFFRFKKNNPETVEMIGLKLKLKRDYRRHCFWFWFFHLLPFFLLYLFFKLFFRKK